MYERSHVSVKVEPRSTSRLISTRVTGNQPLVVLARETALFWQEKGISVDILLRVLARMPLCQKFYHFSIERGLNLLE